MFLVGEEEQEDGDKRDVMSIKAIREREMRERTSSIPRGGNDGSTEKTVVIPTCLEEHYILTLKMITVRLPNEV